jgi:hypothetical protein
MLPRRFPSFLDVVAAKFDLLPQAAAASAENSS